MVKTIIFYHPINHLHHHHLSLLTLCGKRVKQSQYLWEADDSNQICEPGQANLTHTYWELCHPHDFSAFFLVYGFRSFPSTIESDHSAAAWRDHPERLQKRMNDHSTRRSNQVLKLTDYHISRHVASTFKRLTKWATHRNLNHFDYTSGVSQLHNHACCPYISAGI